MEPGENQRYKMLDSTNYEENSKSSSGTGNKSINVT